MGGKKRGLISIGLLFAVLLSWVGVEAQIVIKVTVKIQPKGQTSTSISKSSVVGPGGFYHPVIQRLNKDTYLVLKSGDLKFYFKEAQSYGIERVEDHVLHYAVNGPSTNIVDSVEIADYLNGPIVLKEGADLSCTETQTYFTSDLLYGVDPTDDTYIVHTPPNYPPNANNYGAQSRVLASGHNNPQNHPDAASRTTYLQFGINQIETNGQLNAAYLNLTAVPSSTNPTGSSDPEGHLRLYKVEGPWDEQTLTFANRPSTNLSGVITVTPNDMQEIEGIGYDYTKDITSFVDGRLNNGFPDHGIRISSDSGHVFVSKESIFESASRPSLTLNLISTENADSRILNMGYVQAGDTLHLQYMGLPNALYPLFTDNAVQAEEQLNYGKNSGCQTDNYLGLLPHIEEDTAKSPYFEFALHTELNLPSDEQAYTGIYIEPKILFDNGLMRLPGRIFFDYFAELHDVSPVNIPDGTPGLPTGMLPVALLDGSPSGWSSFGPHITGTTIQYLSHPLARGKTFKIVIAGNIRKGIMVGKANPSAPNAADITKALQNALLEAHPELSAAVANCDINPYGQELEGVFVSCFEFTIGNSGTEIMLGESKYFYTVEDPEDNTNLLIQELEVDAQSEDPVTLPSGGLADAFSNDDLIEVISGGKSGLYWERKRALIDNNGNITTQNLPDGVVRVIGRYWEEGKDYKVKLKASSGSRIGELEITVVKPDKLGENDNQRIYTDALESEYNLDSLAIVYGGRTGMPPQFLKGIISQESSRLASYRYEPGTDFRYNVWRNSDSMVSESMQDNPYWISDENNEGDPAIPMNHIVNEQQGNNGRYPGYDGTMYDLFELRREIETRRREQVNSQLDGFRDEAKERLILNGNPDPSESEIDNIAQESLNEWLQDTYRGGLSNIPKQTRIVASFGPMQLIYLYGYYENVYPLDNEHLPETMNSDVDVALEFSIRFFIERKFNLSIFSRNNTRFNVVSEWPNGYEESLKRGANAYNGLSGASASTGSYGEEVWLKALNYLPSK